MSPGECEHLSGEDVALFYEHLLEAERGVRGLEST